MTAEELGEKLYHPLIGALVITIMALVYKSGSNYFTLWDISWECIGTMIVILRAKF